jgi:multidrug efflux pump subunit AcrB
MMATIQGQNKMVYPGYFNSGDNRVRLEITDHYTTIEDIQNLIIQGHEHDQLRLKDIADIYQGVETPSRNSMRYDGKPAVGLALSMASGHDITKVGKRVEDKLDQLQKSGAIPLGIDFNKVFFQSDRVNDAIYTFLINLLESILIVIFILMLTMGIRSGIILAVSLLVTVLGSFVFLYLFDGTLQRVSLGALILAMGMLVDNAVVVIDGILVDTQKGMKKPQSLFNTANNTAMPLLGATLIAILAFFPIFLSPDMAGIYVRDLFIVLAVSLFISWLLALVQVPLQADRLLKPKRDGDTTEPFNTKFHIKFRQFLRFVLKHRVATLLVIGILLGLTAWGYKHTSKGFFPDFTYEQAYIEYRMPEGTKIEKTQADLQQIEKMLMGRKEIKHVTSSYGGTPFRYNLVRSFAEPSLAYGELIVDFTSPKAMEKALPELQKTLSENYPQAFVRIKKYNLMYKPFPIEVMFTGNDPDVLKKLAVEAEMIMKNEKSLMLVRNDWGEKAPVLTINYNQTLARSAGVSRSDIGLSLLSATDGIPIGSFYNGENVNPIYLRSVSGQDSPIEDLARAPILSLIPSLSSINRNDLIGILMGSTSMSSIISEVLQPTPLTQITDGITLQWAPLVIRHYNGQRAIRVQCNNQYNSTPAASLETIKAKIEAIPLPEGYAISWLGESQASKESTRYLFANVPIAIVLMIIILIMLFKDLKRPLIIVCCLPLAAIGIVAGLLVSGKEFGFVAIVGALGLIGMMIKNGIVLMDEIDRQLSLGIPPEQSILMATSSRFRPVMMASGTTIVGMIPLLTDVLFGSLAVTIMGGLLVGTLITLVIMPLLYAMFFRVKVS